MIRRARTGPFLELLVLPFFAVAVIGLLTPTGMASNGDPAVYLDRAVSVLRGLVPFRDFSSEYPPLSLIPMTLPHLWPDVDRGGYMTLLVVENGLLASVIGGTLLWLSQRSWSVARPTRVLATWAALMVLMAPVAAWRFDLFAVLLTMLGVMAAARERPGLAGVLFGLGIATKIFPLVVVPILAVRYLVQGDRGGALRLVAGTIATVALVMAPFLVAAGWDALSFVGYQLDRGLQVESGGGAIVLLAHTLGGLPASIIFSHQSFEADSPASAGIIALLTPLLLAGYALILLGATLRFRQERARLGHVEHATVIAYLVAAMLLLLLANKVFSPQYLLWLLPMGALLPRPKAIMLMTACLLTTLVYPINYDALVKSGSDVIRLLNVRNLLLLLLMLWLLVERAPQLRPAVRRPTWGARGPYPSRSPIVMERSSGHAVTDGRAAACSCAPIGSGQRASRAAGHPR